LPILLISLTLISGCSSIKELEIFTKKVERTPLNLDPPKPMKMEKVEWLVITEKNYKEVFEQLKKNNKDIVLFGLTDDGYEQLAVNFAQVRKYIILNRDVLMRYKEYYEGKDSAKETTRR
jgi:hypothetical protein